MNEPYGMAPAVVVFIMKCFCSDLEDCEIRTAATGVDRGAGKPNNQLYKVFTAKPAWSRQSLVVSPKKIQRV